MPEIALSEEHREVRTEELAKLREVDATVDPISTHRGMGYSLREDIA